MQRNPRIEAYSLLYGVLDFTQARACLAWSKGRALELHQFRFFVSASGRVNFDGGVSHFLHVVLRTAIVIFR